jgi:hypothetical protein
MLVFVSVLDKLMCLETEKRISVGECEYEAVRTERMRFVCSVI